MDGAGDALSSGEPDLAFLLELCSFPSYPVSFVLYVDMVVLVLFVYLTMASVTSLFCYIVCIHAG